MNLTTFKKRKKTPNYTDTIVSNKMQKSQQQAMTQHIHPELSNPLPVIPKTEACQNCHPANSTPPQPAMKHRNRSGERLLTQQQIKKPLMTATELGYKNQNSVMLSEKVLQKESCKPKQPLGLDQKLEQAIRSKDDPIKQPTRSREPKSYCKILESM
ncbi:hypothetical protein Dimus_033235, partial [Dionaea muscipula]